MSIKAMSAARLSFPADWPPARRLVALLLADHVDDESELCWPSLRTLADDAGLNIRMVRYHLRAIEEAGWVEREPRFHNGHQRSNVWLWKLWTGRLTAVDGDRPNDAPGGNPLPPLVQLVAGGNPATDCRAGGQPSAPRTISRTTTESSREPSTQRAVTRRARALVVGKGSGQ